MSNIVLADEINRTSAKTQASLLEAMAERQVTVDSKTYKLKEPFMVLATQNPLESFGTYPLPEAQIDRFMIKISLGYPNFQDELNVMCQEEEEKEALQSVCSGESILKLQQLARRVYVSPDCAKYMMEIVSATRDNADLLLGCSPRGGIALYQLSRTYALLQGRTYVSADDVKYLAPFVLSHRVILNHEAKMAKKKPEQILDSILGAILVPVQG